MKPFFALSCSLALAAIVGLGTGCSGSDDQGSEDPQPAVGATRSSAPSLESGLEGPSSSSTGALLVMRDRSTGRVSYAKLARMPQLRVSTNPSPEEKKAADLAMSTLIGANAPKPTKLTNEEATAALAMLPTAENSRVAGPAAAGAAFAGCMLVPGVINAGLGVARWIPEVAGGKALIQPLVDGAIVLVAAVGLPSCSAIAVDILLTPTP